MEPINSSFAMRGFCVYAFSTRRSSKGLRTAGGYPLQAPRAELRSNLAGSPLQRQSRGEQLLVT